MIHLDELALGLPETTKEVSADGRPSYLMAGEMLCLPSQPAQGCGRWGTGERVDDVLLVRVQGLEVKEVLLAAERGVFFTTPHFRGYPAILVRITGLADPSRDEQSVLIEDAWLTRVPKRLAKAWQAAQATDA